MAQIVLDVPDNQVSRVLAALTDHPAFAGSGLTAAQFAKQRIANMVKGVVVRYETEQAKTTNDINVT